MKVGDLVRKREHLKAGMGLVLKVNMRYDLSGVMDGETVKVIWPSGEIIWTSSETLERFSKGMWRNWQTH